MYVFQRIANQVHPYRDRLIVCRETAADFLNLSNGGMYESRIHAYASRELSIQGFAIDVIPDCFEVKHYEKKHGILCTTPEQTILDLLEHEREVDIQTLLEALSNYYFHHHGSFNGLEAQMTAVQRQAFQKWRHDSINYYTEEA